MNGRRYAEHAVAYARHKNSSSFIELVLSDINIKTFIGETPVCTENLIRVDDVMESLNCGMIGLLCFVLAVLASPFKSKSRLEAENAVR